MYSTIWALQSYSHNEAGEKRAVLMTTMGTQESALSTDCAIGQSVTLNFKANLISV